MPQVSYIGRYKIIKMLGQGNMGCVYLAFDPNLQRKVAIKTIRTGGNRGASDGESFSDRFFREAKAISQLNHPNIVAIFDSGFHEGEPFIVMEYLHGSPMDEILARGSDLDHSVRMNLLKQMALGLDFAHAKGVIHRDIKPANTLVTNDLVLKIVDFGLARFKDSNLTTTDVFLGTPSYASPEQVLTGQVDALSDNFSFGIVVFEMLFEKRPFPGESISTILYHIAHSEPQLEAIPDTEPLNRPELERIFKKTYSKEPSDRYHRCLDMVKEIQVASGMSELHQNHFGEASELLTSVYNLRNDSDPETLDSIHYEETVALVDRSKPPEKRRFRLEIAAGIGAALIFFIAIALWTASATRAPEDQPPRAKTVLETSDLEAINQGEPSEPEQPEQLQVEAQPANTSPQSREDQISDLRKEYFTYIDLRNLDEAEVTLLKIESLGENIDSLRRMLEVVEEQVIDEGLAREDQPTKSASNPTRDSSKPSPAKPRSRLSTSKKLGLQNQFKKARSSENISKLEQVLSDYRRRYPGDIVVIENWEKEVEEIRETRSTAIRESRQTFDDAARLWDLPNAEKHFATLQRYKQTNSSDASKMRRMRESLFIDNFGITFVRIPAGTFTMGSRLDNEHFRDAAPLHEITILDSYMMSNTEVTQQQWQAIMGNNPSLKKGSNLPVENVSWRMVTEFIEKLNQKAGHKRYRLPTEEEWEYACRAGSQQPFQSGKQFVGIHGNSKARNPAIGSMPVKSFAPNGWGLFDMHGNVWEWCSDIYRSYEKKHDPDAKKGFFARQKRVVRGGSFNAEPEKCAAGSRSWLISRAAYKDLGFRLVLTNP